VSELVFRAYQNETDYWRIRQFLRRVYALESLKQHCWSTARFDYWRWHGVENIERVRLEQVVFLWEKADGEIAAVLHPEGKGEAFLQVHPEYRTAGLENEMLAVAEQRLCMTTAGERARLRVWAQDQDGLRQEVLHQRGYRKVQLVENQRWQSLDGSLPQAPLPAGYTLRALGNQDELPQRSWLSWIVFHPDEPPEHYEGWEWYLNIQRIPLYRRDLDLVAVASNGELPAFCTIWFDDVTRSGMFEPVGTAPAHQRRGLGKALLCEGLRRLKHLGADTATVGSYSPEAGALYAAVRFTRYTLSEAWEKQF